MRIHNAAVLALTLAAFGAPAWAAQKEKHDSHHPAPAAAATAAKTAASPSAHSGPDSARVDAQIKSMHDMHVKMMAAKTPSQRDALMAQHMKTRQVGMDMMGAMHRGGMGNSQGGMMGDMKGDMAKHHQMMQQRMDLMQGMMQMMMDRLPAAAPK